MNTGNSSHATDVKRPDTDTLNETSGFNYFEKHQHEMTCLQERDIKNIRRETWHHDAHGLIIKRYIKTAAFPDIRRLWLREHRALHRLQSLGMPTVHGLSSRRTTEGQEILLFRDHLKGAALERLSDVSADDILRVLTPIYRLGVLTCDPTAENIIRTCPEGRLCFIDFSKGRIFAFKTPFFYHYLGKEFMRIIKLNPEATINWQAFRESFIREMNLGGLSLYFFNEGCRHWSIKWKCRI